MFYRIWRNGTDPFNLKDYPYTSYLYVNLEAAKKAVENYYKNLDPKYRTEWRKGRNKYQFYIDDGKYYTKCLETIICYNTDYENCLTK